MRESDAGAVATLVHAAFATQSVPVDPPASALRVTAEDVVAHLRVDGAGGAVVEIDDVLAGSVMWSVVEDGLYIARLSVAPAWRRRGVARALLAAAADAARMARLPRVHLGTRLVLEDNRRLFGSAGFVEVSRHAHPGYAEPTWVAMEKRLG